MCFRNSTNNWIGGPGAGEASSYQPPAAGVVARSPRHGLGHLRPGSFIWRFPMAYLEFCLGFGQDDKSAGCCFPGLGHGLGRGDASKRSGQDTADGTAQGTLRSSVFVGSGSSRHITKASIVNASCQPVPGKEVQGAGTKKSECQQYHCEPTRSFIYHLPLAVQDETSLPSSPSLLTSPLSITTSFSFSFSFKSPAPRQHRHS